MNIYKEVHNLYLNQVNTKNRNLVDTLSYSHNKNISKFPRLQQSYPPIATTVSMNSNDQHVTSKIRSGTRGVEDKEDSMDIDSINIRKYFDPRIYRMLLNPKEHSLRSERLVIVFWDITGFASLCNRLNKHPFIIVDLLRNFF